MSGFLRIIIGVCVSIILFYTTECTVTVTNESGHFLCGKRTNLKCHIHSYGGGMTWKLDGSIIAQCAFGSCNPLGALPTGDVFTHNEATGTFYLDIGITHADNGTKYQCDDGSNQDQITVNIKVPPDNQSVTVTDTNLICTAGCFYPATDGRMEVYCVTSSNEVQIGDTVALAPTATGCTGDCAGPGIFTATGSISRNDTMDNSTGNSKYRVYVYLDGFRNCNISTDTAAIYNCDLPDLTTTTATTTTNATTITTTATIKTTSRSKTTHEASSLSVSTIKTTSRSNSTHEASTLPVSTIKTTFRPKTTSKNTATFITTTTTIFSVSCLKTYIITVVSCVILGPSII